MYVCNNAALLKMLYFIIIIDLNNIKLKAWLKQCTCEQYRVIKLKALIKRSDKNPVSQQSVCIYTLHTLQFAKPM